MRRASSRARRASYASLVSLAASIACVSTLLAQDHPVQQAAPPPPSARPGFTFQMFLGSVGRGNLELAAERANVPISEARIDIARIFPDPVVTVGLAQVDISGHGAPVVTTAGVNIPIELGNKRGHRIEVAQRERELTSAELDDFLRNLRADAADAWIDALEARLVLARKRQSLESLERLVGATETRLNAGEDRLAEVIQARVEAARFHGDVLQAQGEVLSADYALIAFLGPNALRDYQVPLDIGGDLRIAPRQIDLDVINARALENRADLRARHIDVDRSSAVVDLAQANRWVDVSVGVGWQHSFQSGSEFNTPGYDTLGATLSVPIPFSHIYRGELDAAERSRAQSETRLASTALRVQVEVRQAVARYQATVERLELYRGELLSNADRVVEFKRYAYLRGDALILEVLNAQRTDDEVYIDYYGVLSEHAHALIALERVSGTWDVDF